ncbi:MAG TPA: helix-turn-helix transcriptional regulator [Tepidisphaeraceae bacterium]|nr:helix-turn-helix transcriptional regulator [Tepidisphaeraceae bacterium]
MTFGEKLDRLVEGGRRTAVSRAAGLPPNAISDYINKGHLPRLDKGQAIARALGVSLGWLADDEVGYPPPAESAGGIASLSDGELLHELARRFRLAVLDVARAIGRLEQVDWQTAARVAAANAGRAEPPAEIVEPMQALMRINNAFSRLFQDFSIDFYVKLNHSQLPGGDREPEELDVFNLYTRAERNPALKQFLRVVRSQPSWSESMQDATARLYEQRAKAFHVASGGVI